jgi:tetratricopeptide (TPR) repeat protein
MYVITRYLSSCFRFYLDYKLNNYDDSVTDCSQVLSSNPNHIKGLFNKKQKQRKRGFISFNLALFRRASCLLAKQQYDEAKRDLDILLSIESDHEEAKVRFFSMKKKVLKSFVLESVKNNSNCSKNKRGSHTYY